MESKTAQAQAQSLLTIQERQQGALFGLYVTDAVAMPVHWMYDLRNLKRDYGQITGYVKPLDSFSGSIMNLSNTGGAGRGTSQGDIIGKVILHGKKKYWERGIESHYHVGMSAGENTLEAQLTRLMMRQITKDNEFVPDNYREAYMTFMQTPNSHNDVYAATAHRMFFKNLVDGKDPKKCPDNDGHNVDTIDALSTAIPVIIKYCQADEQTRNAKVLEAIHVTRNVKKVEPYAIMFSNMVVRVVVNGDDLQTVVLDIAQKLGMKQFKEIVEQSKDDPMTACYIDSSFPAMLFFLYKYADSFEAAILANANAGGENVARGALIGVLMGGKHGMAGMPDWTKNGLFAKDEINAEIDQFLNGLNENGTDKQDL